MEQPQENRTAEVLIIGVGNDFRSDDGIGLWIARKLRDQVPPNVRVTEESGEGAALMEAWKGAPSVILFDAVQSGEKPGTIHRLDAQREKAPVSFFHYSSHAFSVAEAIELARSLGELPPKLLIYGIEGRDFGSGTELSPEVVDAAVSLIREVLAALRGPSGG